MIVKPLSDRPICRVQLAINGFVTAVGNPKGWAFFIALSPSFINESLPLAPQVLMLLVIILLIEFSCLFLYATSGQSMSKFLQKSANLKLMNRIAAVLIMSVGIWLAIS